MSFWLFQFIPFQTQDDELNMWFRTCRWIRSNKNIITRILSCIVRGERFSLYEFVAEQTTTHFTKFASPKHRHTSPHSANKSRHTLPHFTILWQIVDTRFRLGLSVISGTVYTRSQSFKYNITGGDKSNWGDTSPLEFEARWFSHVSAAVLVLTNNNKRIQTNGMIRRLYSWNDYHVGVVQRFEY
jgi:hypothetical protein